MNTVTIELQFDIEGDPDEFARLICDYLTRPDCDLADAYGPDASGGYDGPFFTEVTAVTLDWTAVVQ